MTFPGANAEFDELGKRLGISVGRLYRPSIAYVGDYVFAMTDENQDEIDIATSAPKGRIEVYQSVDVTSLSTIPLRVRWSPSPDINWRLQVSIGGVDVWDEILEPTDADRDWYEITCPCAKMTGSQTVAVILGPE